MDKIQEILAFNKAFVENKLYTPYITSKQPSKKIVVLSCMDTRLTELLPQAMNLKNGDAKVIKNAGATIMHPFGSIMRSILIAVYEFNVEHVIVVGHSGCGMSQLNTEEVINKMHQRGISEENITLLKNAGIDVERWLYGFESVEEAIKESAKRIKEHPLFPKDVNVYGLLMDSVTGALTCVETYKVDTTEKGVANQ